MNVCYDTRKGNALGRDLYTEGLGMVVHGRFRLTIKTRDLVGKISLHGKSQNR